MKTNLSIIALCLGLLSVQNVQASSMSNECSNTRGTVQVNGFGPGQYLKIIDEDYVDGKWVKQTYTLTDAEFVSEEISNVEVHKEEGKKFSARYTVVKMKFQKKDGTKLPGSMGDGSRTEIMLCNFSASWM